MIICNEGGLKTVYVYSEEEYHLARKLFDTTYMIMLVNPDKVNKKLKRRGKPILPLREVRYF